MKVEDQMDRISKWMIPRVSALGTQPMQLLSYGDLGCNMVFIAFNFTWNKINFSKNQRLELIIPHFQTPLLAVYILANLEKLSRRFRQNEMH
jgi:hypothetical protein